MTPLEIGEQIAGEVQELLWERRPRLAATYRVQFNTGFTFRRAQEVIPYLHELGISHLYASPYFRATSGSVHGYDVCNHNELNPELGGDEDFQILARELSVAGMGQILDFVPNHMSASCANAWWMDVLENGPDSPYAHFFDIDWRPVKAELADKILLPILGDQYGEVLDSGQLRLQHHDGAFLLTYYDTRLPLSPHTVIPLLTHRLPELQAALAGQEEAFDEYQSIITALEKLPRHTNGSREKIDERIREKEVIKRRLRRLEGECPAIAEFLQQNVTELNGDPGNLPSFDRLDEILSQQCYRLSHWRTASDEINYRRFFDINELAALCMEHKDVFDQTHRLAIDMLAEGTLHGLRIDHIDGLFDPLLYLWNLQRALVLELGRRRFVRWGGRICAEPPRVPEAESADAGKTSADDSRTVEDMYWDEVQPLYLSSLARRLNLPRLATTDVTLGTVWDASEIEAEPSAVPEPHLHRPRRTALPLYVLVEKILGEHEPLPPDWPVAGTTGYDFLSQLNGLFVEPRGLSDILKFYFRFTGVPHDFEEIVYRTKLLILRAAMSSELQMLAHRLNRISEQHRRSRDYTLNSLRYALREILACFPVYRTYPRPSGLSDRDRRFIQLAVDRARRRNAAIDASVFEFIRRILLLEHPEGIDDDSRRERELFTGRFQQVTSPLMAKGVEDTAFYIYCPLVSMNEVGGHPSSSGTTLEQFHRDNLQRRRQRPATMLATSTHDTKRSEDVRARIAVLSERPKAWRLATSRWSRLNRRYIRDVDGAPAPSRNDEYLFYQTLVGMWPLGPQDEPQHAETVKRLQGYMEKATREAKLRTSWVSPHAAYDEAVREFVAKSLERRDNNRFLAEVSALVDSLVDFGLYNALTQTTLKIMSPGVPDIYQGQELWDFSLVDPDNRRPVDFALRRELLRQLQESWERGPESQRQLAQELGRHPRDLRTKLLVTWRALQFRRQHPALIMTGQYLPLAAAGERQEHVCAFAWNLDPVGLPRQMAIVVVPRWTAKLSDSVPGAPVAPLGPDVWRDTRVPLPLPAPPEMHNLFTGQIVRVDTDVLSVGEVLHDFPAAVLY